MKTGLNKDNQRIGYEVNPLIVNGQKEAYSQTI